MKKFVALSLLTLLSVAAAQQPQAPPPANPPSHAATKPEKRMTPEQAQQLFASIDGVFQFVSRDTGLPIKHPVEKKLSSRDEVEKYILSKMDDDEDTKRFERSEVVLKKFGLLPRDFELRPFLVKLLRDQVAGFYDSKTKVVYLLDWVDPEIQKPVMAHELTHALQDQNFDLEKWGKEDDTRRNAAEKRGDYNQAIALDEASTAQTAMVEGQGMITLVDYMLKDMGHSAADSPDMVRAMGNTMEGDNSSPVLASAPLLLKETLIFPYRDGMLFVDAVLSAKGKEAAFSGLFARPPLSSYQVMTPAAYLDHKPSPSVPLPEMKSLLGDKYAEYDLGAIGEFDVQLLLKQFSDPRTAAHLTRQWDGGSYFAALRKGAPAGQTSSIGLVYVSHWKSPEAATEFARVYGGSLARKYKSVTPAECSPCEAGERRWNTDEGMVEIDQRGNRLLISEGIETPLVIKLKDAVLAGGGEQLQATGRELSISAVPSWMRAILNPNLLLKLPDHSARKHSAGIQ
ncbi:MAG: hypothetical protein ABI383_10785 [Acidobacteriaceae bacterium]